MNWDVNVVCFNANERKSISSQLKNRAYSHTHNISVVGSEQITCATLEGWSDHSKRLLQIKRLQWIKTFSISFLFKIIFLLWICYVWRKEVFFLSFLRVIFIWWVEIWKTCHICSATCFVMINAFFPPHSSSTYDNLL